MQRRSHGYWGKTQVRHLIRSREWIALWSNPSARIFVFSIGALSCIVILCQLCWLCRRSKSDGLTITNAERELGLLPIDSRMHVLPEDRLSRNLSTVSSPTFGFVFSTGRSGTQHLSLALQSSCSTTEGANDATWTARVGVYVTHEEEDDNLRTRDVVCASYRRLVHGNPNQSKGEREQAYYSRMKKYVTKVKLPFYNRLLKFHQHSTHLVYTGHIPTAFGVFPVLLDLLPTGSVRLLRFRRDRLATALSLMALGPEMEDPWGGSSNSHDKTSEKPGRLCSRRWFPTPWDAHVRLSPGRWDSMNRFQRWLWYVDDVECRWHALKRSHGSKFSFMEESLDSVQILGGGEAWHRIGKFLGAPVDSKLATQRHNSIETKHRNKLNMTEATLRAWDEDYRDLVGPCQLSKNIYIRWP